MTKFSDTAVAQAKHNLTLSPPEFVENVECAEMTVDDITEDHIDLTKRMLRFLTDINGLGLAAPQIGIEKRFFVYWNSQTRPQVIYNPKWYPAEKKKEGWVEKCLTYGDLGFLIERYKYISALWWEYDPENKNLYQVTKRLRGVDAHVFQHETDHLNSRTLKHTGIPMNSPTN